MRGWIALAVLTMGCGGKTTDTAPPPTDPGPTTTVPAMQLTTIGDPMWQVADVSTFTAPLADATEACLLNGNHVWDKKFGIWAPGTPHDPPYDAEISAAAADCGYRADNVFEVEEHGLGNGIWLSITLLPESGNAPGSSPDFGLGDVIYNDRFPIVYDADVRRDPDDLIVDPDNDGFYPGVDVWGYVVTGHSHAHLIMRHAHERMPLGARPDGMYTWNVLLRDSTFGDEKGYDLIVPFRVKPAPETTGSTE